MLVTAGWQETKKSPASRLAGDLALIIYPLIAQLISSSSRTVQGPLWSIVVFGYVQSCGEAPTSDDKIGAG